MLIERTSVTETKKVSREEKHDGAESQEPKVDSSASLGKELVRSFIPLTLTELLLNASHTPDAVATAGNKAKEISVQP